MALSPQTKTSVALGFGGVAVAVMIGALVFPQLQSSKGGRRTAIHWQADGGDTPPDGTIVCILQEGVGLSAALGAFGLDAGAGKDGYAICRACAVQVSADTPEVPLPPGINALEVTQDEVAFDGGPQFQCALQGEPEFACACSTGSDCTGPDGGAAPRGSTLQPGEWDGGGCFSKACMELAGYSSWPAECPP